MKKLIIAAAIVCAAVMSQAAVVEWSIGAGKTAVTLGGTVLANHQITLMLVGLSGEDPLAFDVRNTTDSQLSKGKLGSGFGTGLNKTAKYNDTGVAGGGFWNSTDGDLGREYYIVITAEGSDGKTYTYTSSAQASSGLSDSKPGKVDFAFTDTTSTVAGTKDAWVSAAVPEPTSGLLMLLGVAGLALRRRRA